MERVLGEGAELQVFAATHLETGLPVVVKRPHPSLVARGLHRDVERRQAQVIALRAELGDSLPHLPRLVAYTGPERHSSYFKDSLSEPYTVVVEERARGIPLVGSAVDGIMGQPIGLPQNLFALHPLVPHPQRGAFSIQRDILDVAEAFYDTAGLVLRDLRPQNVFFDPLSGRITVIDVSSIAIEQEATRRRPALGLHDFYLEMFKWYISPFPPSDGPEGYYRPLGMGSVPAFARDLKAMTAAFSGASLPAELREAATQVLHAIGERQYEPFRAFRRDFEGLLEAALEHYRGLAAEGEAARAWRKAASRLREAFWQKFLFDAERDMAGYFQ